MRKERLALEIYRKEWGPEDDPDGTIINATILGDWSLRIDGTDYGASARGFSGRDKYEYGLHINADDVPALVGYFEALSMSLLPDSRAFNARGGPSR